MTILVVDDEPEYRLMLRNVLVNEGFTVVLAENGEDGYRKLKETAVDLIISDIYMPVMDGIKFHKAVRDDPAFPTLPFLFVSAYDDQHTLEAVKNAKCEGFLRKARPVSELKEWIQYLTTPEAQRSPLPPGGARSRLNQQLRRGYR
jgi:two-component system, chemotaxis family, chemotaxis protein CheY